MGRSGTHFSKNSITFDKQEQIIPWKLQLLVQPKYTGKEYNLSEALLYTLGEGMTGGIGVKSAIRSASYSSKRFAILQTYHK